MDENSLARLQSLLRVIQDVIRFATEPSDSTFENIEWLAAMLDRVDSTCDACSLQNDLDREKLETIKSNCVRSLIDTCWFRDRQKQIVELVKLLPVLERAIATTNSWIDLQQRATVSTEMSRPIQKQIVRTSLDIGVTKLKKMIRNRELGLVNVPGTQMVRMLQSEFEKLFP